MIGLAIAVFGGLLVGAYLHEIVHLGVARAFGASVALDPVGLEAFYQFDRQQPRWVLWCINLAPQVLGILTLTAWWVVGASTAPLGIAMVLFGTMLLAGGREDYRVSDAESQNQPPDKLV